MRGFSGYATSQVVISRGSESITFEVHPLPFGYLEMIEQILPPVRKPINATEAPPAEVAKRAGRVGMLILAKGLPGQLDAREPAPTAGGAAWEAYADQVRAEVQAAHLVEGDCQQILDVLMKLNRGLGDLPKA